MATRQEQKAATRAKILDAAAYRLREGGPDAVSVQAVMADAGLTHGAFYAHFANKETLVNAAFDHAIATNLSPWFASAKEEADYEDYLATLAENYLSPQHRDQRGHGCALAALASEMGTAPASLQSRYADTLADTVDRLSRGDAANRPRAIEFLATVTGALNLARNTTDRTLSDEILAINRSLFRRT
ncbi:MAG: TetR/AcrR family transcriptional regulator [Proteobacteria bacterium]|jgi:TetR/AcrR family transcriptional regulator, transcriptional repressor for nem operon|nr:TetR/AcrR family transcriptional regulator [Pseudomonadota bacterium]